MNGNLCNLLEEIKKMTGVLKHAEAQITNTANVSAQEPIIQYLQENHFLEAKDHLPSYILSSILIQHYVYFRIALKLLAHTVQCRNKCIDGDIEKKQWSEVVKRSPLFPYLCANQEKSAQEYTPEHVGRFLEGIGLGHHVATFIEQDVSGGMLLEPDQEMMLEELGVTSPTERLKIKVLFRRSLRSGVVQYPIQTVLTFLQQNKLNKYHDTFQQWAIDGDLLLEADDSVLKELGVSSALDRNRIKANYKTFIDSRPQ